MCSGRGESRMRDGQTRKLDGVDTQQLTDFLERRRVKLVLISGPAAGQVSTRETQVPIQPERDVVEYHLSPFYVTRVLQRRCGMPHGPEFRAGVVCATFSGTAGVRPATVSFAAPAAENR